MRVALIIALGFWVFHLGLGALLPFVTDETYYMLWASGLSWGYYDHPPMVAWLIAAGEALFGSTLIGVRFFHILAMALAVLVVADTARQVTGEERSAVWAAAFFAVGCLPMALGITATPDPASILFWAVSVWAVVRATAGGGLGWWTLAGLAAGLGVQTKFTALFLGVGFLIWFIATRAGRKHLVTPGPYVAGVIALLVIAPLAYWNLAHDLVGLERQFGRIRSGTLDLLAPFVLIIIWLVLATPLVGWLAVKGAVTGVGKPAISLLIWTSLPMVAFMAWHGLLDQRVALNWTAPISGSIAILAATAVGDRRKFAAIAAGTGAVLSVGLLGLAVNPWTPLGTVNNPPNQMRGWPTLIAELKEAVAETEAEWIATSYYGLTGMLWHYLAPLPVYAVNEPERYLFREPIPSKLCDGPGLLIQRAPPSVPDPSALFETAEKLPDRYREYAGARLGTYELHAVAGLKDRSVCN